MRSQAQRIEVWLVIAAIAASGVLLGAGCAECEDVCEEEINLQFCIDCADGPGAEADCVRLWCSD